MIRLLGLDPGTRLTGYGVIDYDPADPLRPGLVDAGVFRLDTKLGIPARLVDLADSLDDVLAEHRPQAAAIEEVYAHYKHPRTAIIMAHARGVLLAGCARRHVAIHEVAANRVKQSLVGFGHAGKAQMQRAIQSTFDLAEPPEPPDVADALAVALCLARSGAVDDHPVADV
ncbi:MAG: crossover junction endodeoxyribonuclease RuvC [Planctomycetota bacterium]